MFSLEKHMFLCVIIYIFHSKSCLSEPPSPPTLVLYSPSDLEYTDVLVQRVHDTLTLVCELRGDSSLRTYVWNYVGNHTHHRELKPEPSGPSASSKLVLTDLQESDSGQYMCSAPPFSVTKYIAVQTKGPIECSKGAFSCGVRCVLPSYVCDGRQDCLYGEDEHEYMCGPNVCSQPHMLKCSGARCISSHACCRSSSALCKQPACCDEHSRLTVDGYIEAEYPPLYEDRRAPDDYGFIQSTIYTVTACALIFMIAVVLLVSAICKMQMKRAALRGYSHNAIHIQSARFPPCYEASRLLEERGSDASTIPPHDDNSLVVPCESGPCTPARGLARLSNIFSARYTQVPTRPPDVELSPLPPLSPRPVPDYEIEDMLTPEATFVEGAVSDLGRRDRLTLQLGRFHLSLPRLNRPRPATPTVPQLDIAQVDFVRLSDTYTLNGRTIRLLGNAALNARKILFSNASLFNSWNSCTETCKQSVCEESSSPQEIKISGAEFECPMGSGSVTPQGLQRPPSYMEAVRYKLYGPPPQYLSREGINRRSADHVDEEATNNIEMPPCYFELTNNNVNDANNANSDANNANASVENTNSSDTVSNVITVAENVVDENNANQTNSVIDDAENAVLNTTENTTQNTTENATQNTTDNRETSIPNSNSDTVNGNFENSNIETLSSIIDNLPAIDSDVNANDCENSSLRCANSNVAKNNVILNN